MEIKAEGMKCPSCGGAMEINGNRDVVTCQYCGSAFKVNDENRAQKEALYEDCCLRYRYAKSKSDYFNLITCLEDLKGYKETDNIIDLCYYKIYRLRRKEKILKILKIVLFAAIISAIVLPILFTMIGNNVKYDTSKIEISIVDKRSYFDGDKYYVYLDYRITNNTGATIDYIDLTTNIDNGSKALGTITTSLGGYGSAVLNLQAHRSITKETYLTEYSLNYSNRLFYELYNNSLSTYSFTYRITCVKFGDGKIVTVS